MVKVKRKPGEKKTKRKKIRPLSPFSDPRVPTGHKNLTAFLLSLVNEKISLNEAVREYQNEWCEHPKEEQSLISTTAQPIEERFEYTVACGECGRHKLYQGRPPSKLTKRGWK